MSGVTATIIPTRTKRAGQRGELRLRFAPRGSRTVVTRHYAKTPFGAVRASYPDDSGIAELQITNPSGGVLGGDRLEMEITLESACATILTQAANKAYRGTEAFQHATFHLDGGAFLEYLPHHLIPFAGSNYRQESIFYLEENATLVAWDLYSAGRVARGERFAFDRLSGRTRIFRGNVPQAVDGFELCGDGELWGGYSYLAAMYILASEELLSLAEVLHGVLGSTSRVLASASSPDPHLCTARVLTSDATTLYRALNGCRAAVRAHLDLPLPPREVW